MEKVHYGDLLKEGKALLQKAEIEEAELDAWLLLGFEAKISRAWFYAHERDEAPEGLRERYLSLVVRRAGHIPLQHLTGEVCFMGYDLYAGEQALIPRADTENLVIEADRLLKGLSHPRLLDLCTGSGCILVTLLAMQTGAFGVGADLSREALSLAQKNALRLGVSERAIFIRADVLQDCSFLSEEGPFDLVTANPPYIPSKEIPHLMEEVREHDPLMALDGGEDGLDFYRAIAQSAGGLLKRGGRLLLEIGHDQREAVSLILHGAGFAETVCRKDLSGRDRVLIAVPAE